MVKRPYSARGRQENYATIVLVSNLLKGETNMAIVIKSADENTISIPSKIMALLGLREGDQVKAIVSGETLRLARLDQFLKLRGALAEDEAFDRAMTCLDRAWQTWTTPVSA